jgi:signal transduction histidine kinase
MRGRIEDLGGRMRIDSAPGQGTKVEFRLPVRR